MYDTDIKLVRQTLTRDEYGDETETLTERIVCCDVKSVGQSEFYQAQADGLKPEIKFVLPDYLEYEGEKKIKYRPFNSDAELGYTVLRTFRNNNELEIVCYKEVNAYGTA